MLHKHHHTNTQTEAGTRGVLKKNVYLQISQNSQENTCARVSLLIKLRPATLLKKTLWQRFFPVNFKKPLRTPFLLNTYGIAGITPLANS